MTTRNEGRINGAGGVWKWLAMSLAAIALTNFATAISFRTSPVDIREVLRESFTDVSRDRGMYALEGRPRLDSIEGDMRTILAALHSIDRKVASIETTLKAGATP